MKILWDVQRLTCREVTRLASHAMDRRLTFREQASLSMHYLLCGYCRNYSRQIRLLRRWARCMNQLAASTFKPGLPLSSASRIKKRLQTEISQLSKWAS
jgi:hypothetical protein